MLKFFTRHWWMLAIRGLLAVIFGVIALIWPTITLQALIIIFGIYVLVDGLFTLFSVLTHRSRSQYQGWGWILVEGLAGIVTGIFTLIWPHITAIVLLFLIAGWALVTGILEIIIAIQLRKLLEGEWALILSGILSIVFGLLLFIQPGGGILALVWLIGAYAIVFGFLLILLAFRVRSWGNKII